VLREVKTHRIDDANENIQIMVDDETGRYRLNIKNGDTWSEEQAITFRKWSRCAGEGPGGVTEETLLAILIDMYANTENASQGKLNALAKLKGAMTDLKGDAKAAFPDLVERMRYGFRNA
jgi:hypothetical protein